MVTYSELIRFIWQFLRKQKWTFLAIYVLDCTWAFDALLWPYILHLVIDVFTQHEANRMAAWPALQGPILGAIALVTGVETFSRTMGFLMARAIPKLEADIRMTMFDHVQQHSPQYFNERFAGSLANKITDMTTQVTSILQQLFWPVWPAVVTCVLGAFFLWFVHPVFAWITLIWIVFHLAICIYFSRSCDMYEHRHGEARSTLLGKIVDSLTNNFAVNLFYRFKFENKCLIPYQIEEQATNRSAKVYVEKLRCFLSVLYFITVIVGLNGALVYMWLHDRITTGQVIQVFTIGWNLTIILWNVGSTLPTLFQSFGIAKQAYSVMLDPQDIKDIPGSHSLKIDSGEILFDAVSFQYGEKKLFQNKDVHIHGAERVGLVGYTGSGKSTFAHLILRLYSLQSGKIVIDGQDIAHVTLESLRRQIAFIPQDPQLFHRTLRENICYGNPDASDEEIFSAARLAHCEEFIRQIPQGYEAKVGERGTKLSGGEKQRIAIARAILVDAPILILDEATSSLDSITEACIQDSLEKLMHNRTSIVIAHRLSTLSRMDRILVFDKGKIIEEGTHETLLDKGGLYAQMWKKQVGGFLPESPT